MLRCCVARTAGGLLCHSLAIITDAAHMLSDVAGFLVGAIALVLTSRNANHRYSFGFGRAEVLVALPPSSPALSPKPNPSPHPNPSPVPRALQVPLLHRGEARGEPHNAHHVCALVG